MLTEIRDILTALVELPNGDERIPEMIELIVAMIIKEILFHSFAVFGRIRENL